MPTEVHAEEGGLAAGVAEFNAAMDLRAARYGTAGWTPSGPTDALFPGTYYLAEVDALHRRTYART